MCVCVCVCMLSSHLAVCMCGARGPKVTVSLEQQRNDLQGLLSLISIRGKEIDKDHHFTDGSALCFFSLRRDSVVKKKKAGKMYHQSWKSPDASRYTFIFSLPWILYRQCNMIYNVQTVSDYWMHML